MTEIDGILSDIVTNIPGIEWPPVSVGLPATLASLLRQLEDSEWSAPEAIAARQFRQLGLLANHCAKNSEAFAVRLDRARLTPADLADPEGFRNLPVLTRRELQASAHDLYCRCVPPGHGATSEVSTSGSTGEPVVVRRTAVNTLVWLAMTMRDHIWHKRDFMGGLCAIRANISSYSRHTDWGSPVSLLFRTGPSLALPITADVKQLVAWVADFEPDNLLIYPSTLDAFTRYCRQNAITIPSLRQIRTVGETLSPDIRADAKSYFGTKIADCYSSQEIGYIAIECPESGLYHVMAESVIAEILDDDGEPCKTGEIGRITVTDLHNFATPLIRYDIGDYAQAASPCPCGRGLPAWKRVLGRERNLILMPDGTRHWPVTGFNSCRDIAPVAQYQLVQLDRETVEARLVVERPLSTTEEDNLRAMFHKCVGHPFTLHFSYYDGRIPAGPSGKFEEFICKAHV